MEMVVLLFGCMGKDTQRGGYRIIKRSLWCIRNWRYMDLSKPRLNVLGGCEHPYFKRVWHNVDQNPGSSIRALAVAIGRSQTTVHRVLQGDVLHPLHV
ncbi:hypothetical protein TNCV_358441 [Trichonephila clavipes]|nr:hypothetical protein TNCV_358441 [Trichonephila clavipes]